MKHVHKHSKQSWYSRRTIKYMEVVLHRTSAQRVTSPFLTQQIPKITKD